MKAKVPIVVDGVTLWLCPACGRLLPAASFYADRRTPNGLKSHCKECHLEIHVRTRDVDLHRDTKRLSARKRRAEDLELFRAKDRLASRLREKNERTMARAAVNGAVRSGKLTKPEKCSKCGRAKKVTAHHDDYSKPLDVRWLCYECHGKEHRKPYSDLPNNGICRDELTGKMIGVVV